jgi:hypothetical protein
MDWIVQISDSGIVHISNFSPDQMIMNLRKGEKIKAMYSHPFLSPTFLSTHFSTQISIPFSISICHSFYHSFFMRQREKNSGWPCTNCNISFDLFKLRCPNCNTSVGDMPILEKVLTRILVVPVRDPVPDSDDESSTSTATVAVSKRKSRKDPINFEAALADVRRKDDGKAKRRKTSTMVRNFNNVHGLDREGAGTVCFSSH